MVLQLEAWLRAERDKLSRHAPVATAVDSTLTRRGRFARFLADGRFCL
ncbi:MAG: hypothetical protein GVY33_08250 [Alphaproteobacteria bacterium]|nr:hypothetical protein [Alphaproteobacteria bacterium]